MSSFLRHLLRTLLLTAGLVLLAAWPVQALSGSRGLLAFAVAAGVCWVGAALGHLPHLFLTRGPEAPVQAAMAGFGIRLIATMGIAAPVIWTTKLPLAPFAAGLVLPYLALLALEVRDLVVRTRTTPPPPATSPAKAPRSESRVGDPDGAAAR